MGTMRPLTCLLLTAAVSAMPACIGSETVQCSWGAVCPAGYSCDEDAGLCVRPGGECGNGLLEANEECDGAQLRDDSCTSLGFTSGSLTCDNCSLVTSACSTCGDAVCEIGENASACATDCAVEQVAVGAFHTCALLADRTLRCWGWNKQGQVAPNAPERVFTPTIIEGIDDAVGLAAGNRHTCALHADGGVSCWGDNEFGQLGVGAAALVTSATPVQVDDLPSAIQVSAGHGHSCALLADGTVSCWGNNQHGQLGDGTHLNRREAAPVESLSDVLQINAGQYHGCAVLANQTVACWGAGTNGQLGDGTATTSALPVPTATISNAVYVTAGQEHSCAVLADGSARCWGAADFGQLGMSGDQNPGCIDGRFCEPAPVEVEGLMDAETISAGGDTTCAVLGGGAVFCWGYPLLGTGGIDDSFTPVLVDIAPQAQMVSVERLVSCVVLRNGSVWCWGENEYAQLGAEAGTEELSPISIPGL